MNNSLTGMIPTALQELTELQGLHLSGTALTGSHSVVFCNRIYAITRILRALSYTCLATDNDRNEQPMATADGNVETKAYSRKYLIAIKLSLSLAAQQVTPVAIYPEGYCCSRATLLLSNRINDILTD
jgi:hypothetical protein